MSGVKLTVSLCVGFIVIVVSMFVVSVLRPEQLTDEELRARGVFVLPQPRDIAPFNLTDQNGQSFTRDNLEGAWSFVFFGFTQCPDVCPTSMSILGQVELALRDASGEFDPDFRGILVSVDPDRDDQATLKRYVEAFSPRFTGLRADRDQLAPFARQLNVAFAKVPLSTESVAPTNSPAVVEADRYTIDHTGNIVIINPRGHYHGFIKLPHDVETIKLSYQTLAASF